MYKVIINIPEIEDGLYQYRKITVEPFETMDEALKNFYVLAHLFIHRWFSSESMKEFHETYEVDYYYNYTDPYGDNLDFWLGGVRETYDY